MKNNNKVNIYIYSKTHLISICHELHMKSDMIDTMVRIMIHLEERNLHPVDYILTKDFYPIGYPERKVKEVGWSYSEWIKELYEDDSKIFIKVFDYYRRPSLKKFLQLLFRECMI